MCGVGAEAAGAAARDRAERLCNDCGNQNVVFAQLTLCKGEECGIEICLRR